MDTISGIRAQSQLLDRLSQQLVQEGQCDARTIDRSRRLASQTGRRLDLVLIQLGALGEAELARAYTRLLGLDLIRPDEYPLSTPVLPECLAPTFLRSARAVPIAVEAGSVRVALADPLDPFVPAAIAAASGLRVRPAVAVPIELEAALERLYPDDEGETAVSTGKDDETHIDDAERLKDLASEAPVIRLVNQIIQRAVETRASDIHVEPCEDRLRVRFRYDGLLHEVESAPARLTPAVVSRIKIMAKLDIAERRLPQDGRIKLAVRGQEVDLRVSTIPSLHGETVVLRILDRSAVVFDYDQLGLPPAVIEQFRRVLELPDGLVLVTGSIGSGKTTTLYTGLLALNTVTRSIVTIEDPIEYQLPGITQIQVNPHIKLTFAVLLRELVRQDPNVIMVGEIRDLATAQVALQAALVGRLVLSTLHTNSAASSVTRLREMGIEDYMLAAALRGILAQRLVRRLCVHCRQRIEASAEVIRQFELERYTDSRLITLWQPVGCQQCRDTGYRGRMAVAEFLQPNAEIERLILSRADQEDIDRAAIGNGMVPMFEVGVQAALAGITTLQEVAHNVRRR